LDSNKQYLNRLGLIVIIKFRIILLVTLMLSFFVNGQTSGYYEKALQSYNNDKYEDAYIYLKNALQEFPNHLPSKILLGKTLVKKSMPDTAIKELNKALELGADKNLAVAALIEAFIAEKKYQRVIDYPYIDLNENNVLDLKLQKARSYELVDKFDLAIEMYNDVLLSNPTNKKGLFGLASMKMKQQDDLAVKELADKLMSLYPEDPQTIYLQGLLAQQDNELELALSLFEKAYKSSPLNYSIGSVLAKAYIRNNQYDKARSVVDELLEKTSDEPFLMLLNARLYSAKEENELADRAYDKLVQKLLLVPTEIKDQLPQLRYVSGLADYMMGNLENAQNQLKLYLSQNKNDINTMAILADIAVRQNQPEQVIELLEGKLPLIQSDLNLSLTLCRQYVANKRPYKCEVFLSELRKVHTDKVALNLMQVHILQSVGQFETAVAYLEKHLTNHSNASVYRTASFLYLQNSQEEKALQAVDDLLAIAPNSISSKLLMIDILLGLDKYDESERVVNGILATNPLQAQALFFQAKISYLKGNVVKAQRQAEKLSNLESNSLRLNNLMGNIFFKQNKLDDALKYFLNARRLAVDDPLPSEQIVKVYRLMGRNDMAITELDKLGKKYFLHPKYIKLKAEIYVSQNELKKAAKQYSLLYSLWSDNSKQLLVLGQMQRMAKVYDGAEKSLLRSLDLSPNLIYTKVELLRLYLTQKRISKADSIVKGIGNKHQDNADIQLLKGDIAYAKQQYKKALSFYQKALQLKDDYHSAAVKILRMTQNHNIGNDVLVTELKAIIAKFPDSYFERRLLADYYVGNNKNAEAKEQYLALEKVTAPIEKKFIYNNLANIYIEDNLDTALIYAEKALELDKSNASFFDTKGWILCLQEDFESGLSYLRQAHALNSNSLTNQYHIAYSLNKLGRESEAKETLNAILNVKREFEEQNNAQLLLDSLQ